MEIWVPDMQPIRFYEYGKTPDWINYFPNMGNVTPRNKWIEGMYPSKYYPDWIINNQISIQFRIAVEGNEDLTLYKMNSSGDYISHAVISPIDITPTGWVSEKVYRYNYTPTNEGVYYFESSSAGYRSYKFVVHSSIKFKRRLIKIDYYNTENDLDMIFWDGITQRYSGIAFFTGALFPDSPGSEISAFKTDNGEVNKQRVTAIDTAILKIIDIHYSEIKRVNRILSCDRIIVNGTPYQNEEKPEMELIQGTDLVKMSVKLFETESI